MPDPWTIAVMLPLVFSPPSAPAAAAMAIPEPAATTRSSGYRYPSDRERFRAWALNAFGPTAIAGSVVTASWAQWAIDEPPEWPGNAKGFAQRFGAASATTAITETAFSVLSAAAGHDARYYRSPRASLLRRVGHAVKMTVMARRRDGNPVFSVPKAVSPFAGPLVTRTTIYPERYTVADGALSGALALLMNAGWNLAREFFLPAPEWGGSPAPHP